jgi:hypothetical protein
MYFHSFSDLGDQERYEEYVALLGKISDGHSFIHSDQLKVFPWTHHAAFSAYWDSGATPIELVCVPSDGNNTLSSDPPSCGDNKILDPPLPSLHAAALSLLISPSLFRRSINK